MPRKGDLESYRAERDTAWQVKERARKALSRMKARQDGRKAALAHFTRCKLAFEYAKERYENAKKVMRLERELAQTRSRSSRRYGLLDEVPLEYEYGDIKVVERRGGGYHVYYGGDGKADGKGHGHVHLRKNGCVYHRLPVVKQSSCA